MKFDVDKFMQRLVVKGWPHRTLSWEMMNVHRLVKEGLRARPGDVGTVGVWRLTFGQENGKQRTFYGFEIREACLKAKKFLKKAKPKEIEALGSAKPKKANHYQRKQRGRQTKQADGGL